MERPRITRCGDGYFRRVIYGLGPYIADYPEQALLACIISGWCPKSVYIIYLICYVSMPDYRCTADQSNLDSDPNAVLRSHEHTAAAQVVYQDNLKGLWDGYGVVGELIVSLSASKHSQLINRFN